MLQNIQLMRAVAAYLVVFYHAQAHINNLNGNSLETHIGASGVDIFFVISGFIMVFTSECRERSTTGFWKDRIIRIVPLYWLATLCMVALSLVGFSPSGLHGWDATSLFTSLFFLPTIRPDGNFEPILSPGWTLIYEMFFYFLFGLGLLLRDQLRSVLVITGLFLALWVTGRVFVPSSYTLAYYMSPLPLEFAAGCFLGLLYTRSNHFFAKRPHVVAISLFVIGIAVIISSDIFFRGMFMKVPEVRLLVFGIPAVFIVTAALILERSGRRYSGCFLLLQGAASYAVYLFHPLLLQSTFKAGKILAVDMPVVSLFITLLTLLALIVVCLGGTLIHLWIEKPLSSILRRTGGGRHVEAYGAVSKA